MGVDWLDTLTGLTQSLQSFIWGMGINWLDTVTSVLFYWGFGGTLTLHSHFSRLSGGMGLTGLTQSLQSFIWGVWGLIGFTQSLQSSIWGYGG